MSEALDLAPIEGRAAAATPGPWSWRGNMDNEDPRLVGRNHVDENGRRRFPGNVEVLWSYSRERQATDPAALEYRQYLADSEECSESELDERVRDDFLTGRWGEPIKDRRLCFTSPECYALDARELAVFEVARARGLPDDTPRTDPKVYRADIVDVRHPDAQFIAHARKDVDDLLAEVRALRATVQRVEALAERWRYKGEFGWGAWQEGNGPDQEGCVLDQAATDLRAALSGDSLLAAL